MKLTKKEKVQLIKKVENHLTEKQVKGLYKQFNRGIIAECIIAQNVGMDKHNFDNITGSDLVIDGKQYEFKYMGYGSSPSVSELKLQPGETKEQLADRILEHYQNVDGFIFYLENDFNITLNRCFIITKEQLKEILINEPTKVNKKIRLSSKKRIRNIIKR